jgi:hypothetical protein
MNHCIARIVGIIAEGRDDRRSVLQLGYNLGRLSELTGLGREPFWDRWKDAVSEWDLARLRDLARDLPNLPDLTTAPPAAKNERNPSEASRG